MINRNRSIENAWSMLRYLYFELANKKFDSLDISEIQTLDDLYALVLAKWCEVIAKDGLYKEYITVEDDELSSPRGQINFQATISQQTMTRGYVICSYDELSDDVFLNHVLKGTLQYFLYDPTIDKAVKLQVKKAMTLFNGIQYVDIEHVRWKDIKYNNQNIRYKHAVEVCKTLLNERKMEKQFGLDDNRRLYMLFKKQIMKYIQVKYGTDTDEEDGDIISYFEQPYTMETESPFDTMLYKQQRMTVIKTERQALLILVRLQDEDMYDVSGLPRKRLEEMALYCREYQAEWGIKTAGCIAYVNIHKNQLNLQKMTINSINNFLIGETVIDIHDQWRFVTNKVDEAYRYFIQRDKNKHKPGGGYSG